MLDYIKQLLELSTKHIRFEDGSFNWFSIFCLIFAAITATTTFFTGMAAHKLAVKNSKLSAMVKNNAPNQYIDDSFVIVCKNKKCEVKDDDEDSRTAGTDTKQD